MLTSPLTNVYLQQEIQKFRVAHEKVITLPTDVRVFLAVNIVRYPSKL